MLHIFISVKNEGFNLAVQASQNACRYLKRKWFGGCHTYILSSILIDVSAAAACSSVSFRECGEGVRNPGKGGTTLLVPCGASLQGSGSQVPSSSGVMGQGRVQIPSQAGFQSQRWQHPLCTPKLSSSYHNNGAHPLQSGHSTPGVWCSAVALKS